MYIELSTDDLAVLNKAITGATPSLGPKETMLVTIQTGRTTGLYHLDLSTRTDEDAPPEQGVATS